MNNREKLQELYDRISKLSQQYDDTLKWWLKNKTCCCPIDNINNLDYGICPHLSKILDGVYVKELNKVEEELFILSRKIGEN